MKKILNLEGVHQLTKNEQRTIKGKGDGDLLACRCPNGQLVVGHADNCDQLINLFCALDS